MIAHVAEVSEHSGRVLVWLDPASSCVPQALTASARIAAAYGSEIETVVVGAIDLSALGDLPVRRVAGVRWGGSAATPALDIANAFDLLAQRHRRTADGLGATFKVPVRHTRTSGDAVDRLAELCGAHGPWNIITLSRAPSAGLGPVISDILANVSGATGVVVAGREREPRSQDVVVAIEDSERLPSMLRAAERLRAGKGRIRVLIAAASPAHYSDIEAAVRLATEGRQGLVFEASGATFGVEGALDERLFKSRPGFVIARFGGTLLANGRALARTMTMARAPFLLVR